MSAFQVAFEALRNVVGDVEADRILAAVESEKLTEAADHMAWALKDTPEYGPWVADQLRAMAMASPAPAPVSVPSAGAVYREVWDAGLPPGGLVCSICGQPVESEPCPDHAPKTAVEFGVRAPDGDVLTPTVDRAEAEQHLARFRAMWPTAVLVQRTVRYGTWTEVTS